MALCDTLTVRNPKTKQQFVIDPSEKRKFESKGYEVLKETVIPEDGSPTDGLSQMEAAAEEHEAKKAEEAQTAAEATRSGSRRGGGL